MKFVETQHPCFSGEVVGCEIDWVPFGYFAKFQLVAVVAKAIVHVEHKGMKVRPPFELDRATGEKQIHQHGLAAADVAPDVKSFEFRLGGFALTKQPPQ